MTQLAAPSRIFQVFRASAWLFGRLAVLNEAISHRAVPSEGGDCLTKQVPA